MKNLTITTRLAVSIVFLLGALLFFAHAYYHANLEEETTLQQELDGVKFLTQVTKTSEALSRHRITLFRIRAGETGFEANVAAERQKIDEELHTLEQYFIRYGESLKLSDALLKKRRNEQIAFEEFQRLWKAIASTHYAQASPENYNTIFNRLLLLSEYVGETSKLIADSDLASFSLTSAITLHVTEVIMRTLGTESDGYEAVVAGVPASHHDQLSSWDYGMFVRRDNLRLVQRGIENSDFYEIDETPELKHLDTLLRESMERFKEYGTQYSDVRIALGEGNVVEHARYVSSGLGFTQAMYDLWYVGAQKLTYMLAARKQKASRAANKALAITLAVIALALGFFVYVTRGIVASLRDIEMSMDKVANGELELEIPHMQKQDEIGSMARTLERFRRSYWWLRD